MQTINRRVTRGYARKLESEYDKAIQESRMLYESQPSQMYEYWVIPAAWYIAPYKLVRDTKLSWKEMEQIIAAGEIEFYRIGMMFDSSECRKYDGIENWSDMADPSLQNMRWIFMPENALFNGELEYNLNARNMLGFDMRGTVILTCNQHFHEDEY